ncbi:CopD family protein [Streptomyces silvensis]|uniref:CopD family protein n=1 Tax=Streptomyces silvensis TaxID=1765722 RepID=UPI001F529683|nr:CopD family protein [Streptomyces silvensis]
MSSIGPPVEPGGETADAAAAAALSPRPARADARPRPAAVGRAVAVLVLVAVAAVVPLFGPSAVLEDTGEARVPGTEGITFLRTVLFGALCVQLGEVFVARVAARVPGARDGAAPARWGCWAAVAGCAAALGLAAFVAGGNLVPHQLSDLDVGGLSGTRDGRLALIEVNAFVVAALCARSRRPDSAVLPLAAVIVAEALRAHPPAEDTPLIGSGLTLVHLTCAALWAGGLLYALRTVRTLRTRAPEAGVAVLTRYARAAALLFAAITATGIVSTLRRMPPGTVTDQLTETAYGRTLLAKVLLVTVVAVLALLARRRLGRSPKGRTAAAYAPARVEVVVLALVVAVSALLTVVPLPIRW